MDDSRLEAFARALFHHAGADPGIAIDELEELASQELGLDPDELEIDVLDELIDDGDLALLADGGVVAPAALVSGSVFTHVVTADELDEGVIESIDLAALSRIGEAVTTDGDVLEVLSGPDDVPAWALPEALLDSWQPGTVIAVRTEAGDELPVVSFGEIAAPPEVDPELVADLRTAYDRAFAEPELPVDVGELVWTLLVERRNRFAEPNAPLTDLLAAAGLVVRGSEAAHDSDVWRQASRRRRVVDALMTIRDRGLRMKAIATLSAISGETAELDEAEERRALFDGLVVPAVFTTVADVVLDPDGRDPDEVRAEGRHVEERLTTLARRDVEVAAARTWSAMAAEREGRAIDALAHLEAAVAAAPDWPVAVDRLAWYRFDAGEASGAKRLWQRVPGLHDEEHPALQMATEFADQKAAALGRNERCWCGSGKKYKACHLGRSELPPLPERFSWLLAKVSSFVQRSGRESFLQLQALTLIRAGIIDDGDPADLTPGDYADPLILDVLLHEGGWFERFLAERGPLLPDDERLLLTAWALVDRTVAEVEAVEPGETITVRDLRSQELVVIRERTASRHVRPGTVWCVRMVPDGELHQIIGGLFPVAPGREGDLLDLLDARDGPALLEWRAAMDAPPIMTTREGEPLVDCRVTFAVDDVEATRRRLDRLYEATDPGEWVQVGDVDGESILRASLRLDTDAAQLHISTMSEARMDRVIEDLASLPGLEGVTATAEPVVLSGSPAGDARPDEHDGEDLPEELRAEMWERIARMEEKWCDEEVPALSGMTPRAAAADPTRRETLVRLLASFPEPDETTFAFRPSRLRELLDLD